MPTCETLSHASCASLRQSRTSAPTPMRLSDTSQSENRLESRGKFRGTRKQDARRPLLTAHPPAAAGGNRYPGRPLLFQAPPPPTTKKKKPLKLRLVPRRSHANAAQLITSHHNQRQEGESRKTAAGCTFKWGRELVG